MPITDIEHFGRPLKNHLIGTYNLLKYWGNAEHICMAGLFQSVYGTKTYKTALLEIEDRDDIRKIIGDDAELLAFVFGMSDRK